LPIAVRNGHVAVIRYLLELGVYVDGRDDKGSPVLHWAVRAANRDLVLLLFKYRCDIKARGMEGRTALHWAVLSGSFSLISLLITLGSDGLCRDMLGSTAPGYFVQQPPIKDKTEIEAALKRGEIDSPILSSDPDGSIIHAAITNGESEVVQILLTKGIFYVNGALLEDLDQYTPLALVVIHGHEDVVRLLLNNGANFNSKAGKSGERVIYLAI
jgi:ankyrin repeat protein